MYQSGAVVLQWGRRVNTAEGPSAERLMASELMLQWGRRVNTAEGDEPAARYAARSGFNGAAV